MGNWANFLQKPVNKRPTLSFPSSLVKCKAKFRRSSTAFNFGEFSRRSRTFYSQSSPCDHSRKRPALVTTSIVKPRLTRHLNSVMKSSRKRPRPTTHSTLSFTKSTQFCIKFRVIHDTSVNGSLPCTYTDLFRDRQ